MHNQEITGVCQAKDSNKTIGKPSYLLVITVNNAFCNTETDCFFKI
jgi:hypothetical protein